MWPKQLKRQNYFQRHLINVLKLLKVNNKDVNYVALQGYIKKTTNANGSLSISLVWTLPQF